MPGCDPTYAKIGQKRGSPLANKFKKGDIVVLKSGGPPMTVDQIPGEAKRAYPHKPRDDYLCEWFKGATAAHGGYGEHLLEKYEPPKK